MGSGIFFPLCAIPFSLSIIVLFYVKGHARSKETKIYSVLIISNFLGLIIELLCTYASMIYSRYPVVSIAIYKLYLFYIILWISTFVYYIFSATRNDLKKINKKRFMLFFIYYLIIGIVLLILPIDIVIKDNFNIRYTVGPSVDFAYAISAVAILITILLLVKNISKIKNKKYIPVFIFLIIGGIAFYVQQKYPHILMMTYIETLICVIMYFTIENPDLKMLESYHDAKQYAEDLNIEKQMFIYNISQDMKIPLIKTSKYCENLLYSDDLNTYKNGIRSIKSECNSMIQKINSIYDIDIDDIKNIDTDNTKYNLSNLLKLVTSNVKKDIEESNKKIQFITSIDDTLPKELIGDITRLKEVLNKLFKLSIKDTKEGFIEFKVQGLVKGNICRLMISLEDSGKGIETEKLEEMLSKDAKENDLGNAKKIINILGGNLIVSSNVGVGTKVNIVLDQEISISNKKDLDKYEDSYFDKKNILLLGGNTNERKIFMREIDEYNGVMETAESINEVIESIKKHKRYYAIIIDGDIKYHTIKEVVEKLKNIKGFNSNIIVFSKEKEMKSSKNRAIIGIQGYIARPLVEGSVLDTLKNLDNKKM